MKTKGLINQTVRRSKLASPQHYYFEKVNPYYRISIAYVKDKWKLDGGYIYKSEYYYIDCKIIR